MSTKISDFSQDWFSLKGKTAILTGADKNLGLGYALAFAKSGADIYMATHSSSKHEEVRKLIESEGVKIKFITGDLGRREHITEIVEGCLREYGKIDILVNNAAGNHFEDYDTFPDEEWQRVTNINFNAVYYLAHEVGKVMKKQGCGKIINIGSALSFTADNNCPSYVAAKHGVVGLTRWLCNELGKYNVQANCLCPGFFKTEINADMSDNPEFYNHITSRIPAGRWGDPSDLMGTAVFLASKASDYLNGWSVSVDGGFTTVL